MIAVEEARHVKIGADILDHDIRCVAPPADRDVAIGHGKAFECGAIGRSHDIDTGPRGEGQAGRVDRFGARQIGTKRRREPRLTHRRPVR